MRILVVEDDKKIASLIKQALEKRAYAVDIAHDGEYGFDLGVTEGYDLIILDLMLPKIDGITLCQKIRAKGVMTPILMLTARGEIDDRVKGLDSGADDYLVKPFALKELFARIKALTRRPKKLVGRILRVGHLVVDTLRIEVYRRGKKIKLSKKEFGLLQYLMSNKNRVISKEELISHVWDFEADILPNTVEVFISSLRRKLGKPEVIKTLRGFGYKIEEKNVL